MDGEGQIVIAGECIIRDPGEACRQDAGIAEEEVGEGGVAGRFGTACGQLPIHVCQRASCVQGYLL